MNPGGVGSPYGGSGMLAAGDRVGVQSSPSHVVSECSGGLLPQNITTTTITTTTTTTTSSSTTSAREVQPNQASLSGESSLGRSNLASHLQLNGLLLSQFGLYNRVVEVPHTSSKDVITPHLLPSPILNVGEGKGQQQQLSPVPCGSGAAVVPPPGSSTHFTSTTSGSTHITNPTSGSSLYFTKPSPGSSSICFTNPTSGSSHFSTTSDPSTQFINPTNSLPNVCGKRYDQLTVVTSVHTEVTGNLSGISMCGEKERVTGSGDAGTLQSPVAGVSGASSGTYPARNAVFPSPNSVKTPKGKRKISLEEMVNKLHKCVPSKNVVNCEVSQEVLSQKSIPSLLCINSSNAEVKSSESRQIISNVCDNNNTANNNNAHASTASTVKDTLQIKELNTKCLEKSSDHCDNPKEVIGASVESCGKSYASEGVPVQLKSDKTVEKSADDRTGSIKSVDCPQKVTSRVTPVQEVDSDGSRLHLSGDCESRAEGSGQSSGGIESKNKDAQSEVLNTFCLKGQNSPKEVTTSVRGEPVSVGNVMDRQSDASTSEKKVRNESADEKNVQVPTERCTAQSPAESGYEGRSSIEPTDSETRDSDIEVVFEKSCMSETGNEHAKPAQEISGSKFKNGDGDKGSSSVSNSGKNIEEIDLSKGDSDSNPSASFLNTDSGLVQYLEPISDDENSLLCAPCPSSSGLSSVSGVQSSSNTPMFSDTPSDTSHGTLMVKISDAVAAILSDVSDDSLPCSPIASNSNSVDGFNSALQREKLSEKIDSICEKLDRDCAKDGNSKILSGPQSDCPQNSDKPAEKSCTKGEIVSTSDASISKDFIEDMKKDDSCFMSQTLPHVSIQTGNKQTSVGIVESCKPPSEQTQVHSGNKKLDVSEGKLSDSVCQSVTRTKPDDEPASEVISVAMELLHNKAKEMASVCTRKSEDTTSVAKESHSSETSSATLKLSSSLPAVAPELPPHLHLGNDSISSFCQMSKTATDNHSCQNLTSGSQTLSSHVGNSNTPQSETEDKAAHMLTYSTPKLIQDLPPVFMQESEPFIDNCVEPNTQVQPVLQEGESQVASEKPSSDASSGFKVGHTPDANTDVPRSDTVKHAGTVDMIDPPNDKTRIEIPASLEVMKPDHSIYNSETEDHKTNRNFGSLTCEPTDTENIVTRQGKSDDWSSNKCTLLKLDQSTERDTSIDSSSTLSESAMESVNRCVSDNSSIISDEISPNAPITTAAIEGPTSESCSPVKEDPFMKKGKQTTPVPSDLTEFSDPISGMSLRPKPGELCGDITRDERENAQVPHRENLSLLPVSDSRESSSFASCLSPVAEILTQCDISNMYTKSVEEEVTVQRCTTSDNAFLPNTSTSLDTHSTLVDHSDRHDVVNSQLSCDQLPQPSVENIRKQSLETNVPDSVNTSVDPECPGVNLNPDDQELKSESVNIEVKTPVSEAVTPTIEVKLATSEIETLATEVNTTTTKILSPINEGETLASEIRTPATIVENLASEIKSLTSEVEASITNIGTSVAEIETLTAEIDNVTAEIQTPVNVTGMPNNEVDTITEDEAPPTEVPTPVTNTEMPITEAEMPANEGKASATKGQMVDDDQAIEPKSSGENALQLPHHDSSESCQSQPGGEEVTSTSEENVQPTLSLEVCGQSDSHQGLECSELADTGTNSNVNNMSDICHIGTNNSATVESESLESVTFRSSGMSAHDSEVEQVSAVDVNVSASPVVAQGISDLSGDTTQVCSTIPVDQEHKEEDSSISSQITGAETVATPSKGGTDKSSEMEILMTDSITQQENISGEPILCIDNAAPGLVEHTVNKESETSGKPVFGSKEWLPGDETWENSSLEGKSASCDAPDKDETIPVVANSLPKTKVFTTSSVSPDECRNNVIDPSSVVSLEPKQDNTFNTTPDEGVHSLVKEIDTNTSDGGCMEVNPGTDSGASTQINTETNSDVSEEIRTEIISGPCEEITAKTDPQAHEEMPMITETASGTCEEINIKTDSRDCMEKITDTHSEACAGINTETTDSGTCAEMNTPGIEVKECVDPLPSQVTDSMLQDPIMNVEQRNRCLTSESSFTVTDIEECTGEEAASLTSKTAQITDFETKSPKETLPSPTCDNGEDGMTSKAVVINKDSSQGSDGQNESTFQDVQEKEESEVLEKKDIDNLCPLCTMRITETLDSHLINSHICSTFIHAKLTRAYKFHMMKRVKDMAESFISKNEIDYKDSIYVCRSCKFASKSIDAVRFHLNSHEGVYQVRPGKASCGCNKKKYSFEFHKWLSLIHNSNCYCYKCNYYFGCDNGFSCHVQAMHFIERKCKDCNADVAPEDMIPHLDLHKSEIESKEDEQNTSSTVVTRSGEEKLKLSWNIYDNSLNYLDGKDFCLSTAKKVDDPNFDRNYLKLPLRNDVEDAVVPEEAKLDPGKDISKYLKDKKAVKLPLADNDEIQRQFSFAMQTALLKRMTKKGRRSASSGNNYSRSRKEDDLFTVLGISVQRSRISFKKDNVDNSGTTPSRKCKAKSVFENVGEAGTPVLTRTRSGMVTTKGDPEDKPEEVRLRPTEVISVVDGEWAKEHTYICCSCGAGYLHLADIMDHKWEMHPSVWCAHTMIQGQGVVPLSFCRQYQPPIARPHVLPLPEIPALDSPTTSTPDPTTRERTCTSCHAVFNSESSFHSHLVECGGLSLLSAMKKKSKKGFRFKRRKGQGVPNNRYGNTSQPSTPLKAKNGDRSSGLNTPLNDRSAASAVHTCGVKRRLELAVGSIDNVELKNRLKAIIIGSRGSSGGAVSSSRRFVKMKLRKKVLENRKLRKTRQSDRVKEIASKEQQQAQEKKDEKKVDAKDEKHESIETQTAPNSEEGKETTENVIGKDNPDIAVPKSLKSKSNNKDAKTKVLKKSKKKVDSLKDPGSTEAAVKDLNQTPDTKINILESKEKKTKDTSRKNALQAEKKVKGVKKMNGVIDKGKKVSKKTLNTTGQVNKKAVNAIPAEVPVTSESGGSSVPVKKAVSKSHKAVQTVEVEGFKNLVTLGRKKGKAKKSKTGKMVTPKPAIDSKNQSLSTTKSATKHNASAKKGKASSKKSTGEKGKLAKNEKIKLSTSKKVKEETKNNDSTPKILASEGGLGELIHEKEGESDVQQDKEQLQKSKGTTQTKGRKGKDTGSLKPKDNSVEPSVAPTTSSTKKEPKQKEEEQYISFSEESEEEESEEDYEPEVIHNFRSGRRCGGRLGLRHKRKLINTRYSFRTCYSTREKDDDEGVSGVDSKVTTEINKRKVNYTEKDDDDEVTEEPLTAKRKRKIANYENQDDYTYVPNESSSDLEDEDDLSDKETFGNQESSTRVAGNRVKTRRLSSAEGSVTEDIPVGTLRKPKSRDTSSDSKQEEEMKNTLQDTSSDIKEGEEVKPSLPVGDINVTTGTSTVANTLLSEVKVDNEVKISTAIVTKSTEDISNSNSMEQTETKKNAKKVRPAKGKTKINPQTEPTVDEQDITLLPKKARVMTLLGRLALNSVFQAQVDEVTGKLQRKRRSVRNPEDLISETEDEMENIAAENTSDPSNAPGVTMEEVNVTEASESSVEQLVVEEKHAVESVETTYGSCSDDEEPKGGKTSTKKKMPCNEIQDVPIENIDESVDSDSKDALQRDELALEVCSKEKTQTKQKLKPGKNEAHTKYESEAGVSDKSIDATDFKQEVLSSKKRSRGKKKVAVIEGKNNAVDDAVKKMIKAEEVDDDDDDDNLPLSILACRNKRKESPPMSTETPELKSKKKPPPKKQRLSVDEVKTEGEASVDVEDIASLPPTHTEKYKTPAKNHKMWGSKKSKMTINVDSNASDIEAEALKDSSAEEVSSKVIGGTTKTASKCDIDQGIALGDKSTSSDKQVDNTQTKSSSKKKKKTKVEPKQPNQQTDVKSDENTSKSQVIPTIESPDMMRPDDEATLSSCGGPVADASSSPNATPVKGQRRRSLIEKLKEIPLQLSNQVQTMDSHDPSQLQSVHTSDEKHTTVAASKKKTAKPSQPRKRKTHELANSKVKNKNCETLPIEKNSGNLINAEDSFKTRKNLPGKRKRAMSTSRATPEGKLASPSKDCITESVVDKDIQTPKNPSESTKKRRSGNNSKEVDLHDVNELTCLDCGLGFGSVASLEDHQQDCVTIAFEMSLMQAEDHLYECPHCQVTFALKGTQRKHTSSCRMGKYKKTQNRHDGKNVKKSYKNQPTLPTHMTQPGNKSPATPDTPSRRSMVKGRSCSKENVAGEGDVTHTSPLRDNFVQVLLSHNDKEMGVNDGRLPENIKNLDYIPRVMSVNASSTPKLKRESQVNGRPVNGELKELLSPVNVDDNRWCSVCGCEVVDKDIYNKHRLIEQFSFCCQQPVVLEVCALITQYNLGTDTIRSLVTSAVVYQDSIALSFDATLNLSSSVSSAGNNSSNGNVAKVKEVITSPHCTWIFSTLETIVKRHQTSGTVSIRGTQQEVLRAVTLLEDILKELSESDSAIEKNKMLKSMRETFEAGTRN